MSTYTNLNAELYMPVDGAINIRADKQAARAYHLEEVNPHTRFFHSLDEKARYMLDQELWSRDTVEMYDFDRFKALFKRAYSHKFRFETLLGALKFYQGYALKEVNKNDDGIYTTTYLERFEDRVVMTAIHLSQGDYRQAQDLVDIIIDGRFQPATPTFLNAGRAKGGEMVSCFEGSTPVLTEQGEVPIKEIRIGDKVFGHDGKAHEVEAVHSHKATATVEIDVTGQPKKITSTPEHPYLTTANLGNSEHVGDGDSENLKWKAAADIRPGDFIAASVEDYSEYAVNKIDLKTYALEFWGDVVEHDGKYYRASVDRKSNKAKGHNRCLKSTAVNKEVYLNADFGYLVGLYLAEGYVHKYNGAVKGIRYTFNSDDLDAIYETEKIAARVFGVDPVVNVNRDGSTNVAIWSGVAGHMFLDLFGTGFDTKRVPKIMRSADPDFLYSLACGIFRGDGCGYANGNVMELSNRELVRDIRNILHQFGVLSYVRDKVTQSGNPSSSITVPRSNECNDQFLQSIGRGYEKITAEYSEMHAKWVDGRPVYRVRSVEQASPETVYNLQVAEVNTYVAGGLHVHNCFLIRMEDNMESIGRGINSSLQLSKRGGGVGILLTNIRESGAPIQKVPNTSSGIVPIMKLLEDSFSYANQLGQRQGAGAVYLNAHHPDIMTFLDTKRENADEKIRIKTLSLGVVIPDITFHLAKENREMYLFSPYDVERVEGKPFSDLSVTENYDKWVEDPRIAKRKVRARDFFRTLSELQFESGYPYVLFEDTANRLHPMKHAGRINMSNLCSEISQLNSPSTLNEDLTYETVGADISCNLGSLNVKKMLDLTRDEFVDTVQVAVRALTAVSTMTNIDSVPSVREGNNLSRAIGLGQMNLHGALAHHGLRYGSEEALKLWDNYMALVTWAAMCESAELAREIGATPYFDGSEYATGEWWERVPKAHLERAESLEIMPGLDAPDADDWNDLHLKVSQHGMANAYLQTIPPTGSISYINNSTSSIHPIVNKVEIRKEGKVGRVYYPAPHMRSDNLHLYEDAYEIGPERIIDTYAVSQQWIDQSQSLTLFMKDTATTRDLDRARIYAWRKGVKSIYYIRLRQLALDGTGVTETGVGECESCLL